MDPSLILPYLWVLVVLVFLEGLLAADNAVVMAVMVKHLPPEQRKSIVLWTVRRIYFPFYFFIFNKHYRTFLVDSSIGCNLPIIHVH